MGSVEDVLGAFLEEQINELEAPEEGMRVLKAFVSLKGTKRQLSADELVSQTDAFCSLGTIS